MKKLIGAIMLVGWAGSAQAEEPTTQPIEPHAFVATSFPLNTGGTLNVSLGQKVSQLVTITEGAGVSLGNGDPFLAFTMRFYTDAHGISGFYLGPRVGVVFTPIAAYPNIGVSAGYTWMFWRHFYVSPAVGAAINTAGYASVGADGYVGVAW